MTRLVEARERFATDWRDLQRSLRKESGGESRWSTNLVWPVLALAAGVALGAGYLWRQGKRD